MKQLPLAALFTSVLLSAAVQAQQKKMEAPRPAPEMKQLEYFVGNWHSEAEMKPGPWGPGGKMSGEDKCSWMEGGFFVVCHSEGSGAMGKMHGIGVMGYDAARKAYTWNGFNSMGENERADGSVSGTTWTYTSDTMMGGQPGKGRYTIVAMSPKSYEFKAESSADGKTWTMMMEGKVTKK